MSLIHFNFESHYLHSNTEISIIMPEKSRQTDPKNFYGSGRKYKVLWLLHGTFGDHSDWLRHTNIELYAREKNLVCVLPSGLNANYVNWPKFGIGYDMWSHLTEELMPMLQNWFPASAKREDNFIAGLSMGGMGAMQYAMAHPDKFGAAAILSYAHFDLHNMKDLAFPPEDRFQLMVENAGGMEAYLQSVENVWDRLPDFQKLKEKPKLYFAIGKKDFLYKNYAAFKAYAQKTGLEATFEEFDGYEHEWRFWDFSIQRALEFFGLEDAGFGKELG